MHPSLTLFSLLGLSLHVHAQAQNTVALTNALQRADLTTFASALERANRSEAGQHLLSELMDESKNYTLFAPDNAAFQAPAATTIGDNPDDLTSVFWYHAMQGNFVDGSSSNTSIDSAIFPSVTAGRTLLSNSTIANLEGGKGQVLVWSRNDTTSSIFFLNQSPRVIIRNMTSIGNLDIFVISGILVPPRSLSQTFEINDLSSFGGLLSSVNSPFYSNGTNATVFDALESDSTRGFTLFAPNDAALRSAGTQLRDLSSNDTAVLTLLGNHYINGTSCYSPTLFQSSSPSFISESGQAFTFSSNSSGEYVTSGNSTAKIIKSDALVKNGVIHVIDKVLFNVAFDDAKADAAYQSATSVAAQPTTETGPIGPTATGSSGSGSGSNGGSGKVNGAVDTSNFGVLGGGAIGLVVAWIAFCWVG